MSDKRQLARTSLSYTVGIYSSKWGIKFVQLDIQQGPDVGTIKNWCVANMTPKEAWELADQLQEYALRAEGK